MTFELKRRNLFALGVALWLLGVYGALYDSFPWVRDAHNRILFELRHDAQLVQGRVVHVEGVWNRSHKHAGHTSLAPNAAISYDWEGRQYVGYVKGPRLELSFAYDLRRTLNGQATQVWVDAANPTRFFSKPYSLSYEPILTTPLWYMFMFWSIFGWVILLDRWRKKANLSKADVVVLSLKEAGLDWGHVLGLMILGTMAGNVIMTPWLPSQHLFHAQALSANETLLGPYWQRWGHLEYRFAVIQAAETSVLASALSMPCTWSGNCVGRRLLESGPWRSSSESEMWAIAKPCSKQTRALT